MAKHSSKFKRFIAEEKVLRKKSYVQIEKEHGVLRGTAYTWVKKYEDGTLHIDKRTIKDTHIAKEKEYEFLKKSFALLKEIRSKQQE
jgi:transposase-like protein